MPHSSMESFKTWKALRYFLVRTCSSCTWALNRNPGGVVFYIFTKMKQGFLRMQISSKTSVTQNTAECQALPNVTALFGFLQTWPECDPPLPHLHLPGVLWMFSFQTAWALTSPGYSPSSLTSLPFSTLWTNWSVSLGFVPGILKTTAALAALRWKGSPWTKLMSKSYPWEVLFCPDGNKCPHALIIQSIKPV